MERWFVFYEYGWWLLLLPPVIVLIWYTWRRSHLIIQYWFGKEGVKWNAGLLKAFFRIAAVVLMVIALLGPYWGRRLEVINRVGREVFFVVDVSASMNADDVKPTRLEKVKREIRKVLPQLQGDRVGLIIFTDFAYVQCPLTEDASALNLFLELVNTEQFEQQGTNFREALLSAYNRFSEEDSTGRSHSRSLVLISDGENHGDDYNTVVTRLKQKGVKVFTVGVGTPAGGQVPEIRNGVNEGPRRDKDNQIVISKLTEVHLREIASQFGTIHHTLSGPLDDLGPVMDQLRLQNASLLNRKSELTANNQYQWALGLSLLLLGATFFMLPQRK